MKVLQIDHRVENKLKEGKVFHAITPLSDFEPLEEIYVASGEHGEKKTIANVYPFIAFLHSAKLAFNVLFNFEPVVGSELYRMALDGGLIPNLFTEMLHRETRNGKALFVGQLVVFENSEFPHPFEPYKTKPKSRTISKEQKQATDLLWNIEASKKGRGLISPILAYQFLIGCNTEGIELNFHGGADGNPESVFCLPFTDSNKKGLFLADCHRGIFGDLPEYFYSKFSEHERKEAKNLEKANKLILSTPNPKDAHCFTKIN